MTAAEVAYSERDAGPAEADRGRVLDALAGGAFWILVSATLTPGEDPDAPDLNLKLECGDGLDVDTVKSLLRKTLAALP